VARWLLRHALPRNAREFVVGDLDEEFTRNRSPLQRHRARAWYWSQALRSIVHANRTESVMAGQHSPRRRGIASLLVTFAQDAQFALRALRRAPGYAAAALLTFGLGVGASVAIFSTVNDVMLRPLPFPQPHRLAVLWESNQERGWTQVEAAPANLFDWRERATTLADIAFVSTFPQSIALMANADPVQAAATRVSGNTFDVLGVPPLLGRTFRDDETFTPGLAMLSHHTWQRHFASDQTIVGRSIRLDGRPHEVVGVMGPAFDYPFSDADVWVTFAGMEARQQSIWWRQAHVVRPFARLAPGATFDQAAAELTTIAADLEREYPQTNSTTR
jgi:hypothetical protein